MAERTTIQKLLADAAILVAVAPALVFVAGWTETDAFLGRLGVHDDSAMPDYPAVMHAGLLVLVTPAMVVGIIYFFSLLAYSIAGTAGKPNPLAHPAKWPLLGIAAVGAWLSAFLALIEVGDDSRRLLANFTVVDAIATLIAGVTATVLLLMVVSKSRIARLLLGETVSGTVFSVVIIVVGLLAAAAFAGADRASGIAFGCSAYTGVEFEGPLPEAITDSSWMLIAHQDGFYFLRDPNLHGHNRTAIAVADRLVDSALYSEHSAQKKC